MADVFLSYASQDRESVRPLVDVLQSQGLTVWWDREIIPGASFNQVIEQELADARSVVVVWTRHSVNSQWVQSEAAEGLERGILVPVFLEDVRPPILFRHHDGADLRRWDGRSDHDELRRLLAGIRRALAGASSNTVSLIESSTEKSWLSGRAVLALAGVLVVMTAGWLLLPEGSNRGLRSGESIAISEIVDAADGERNLIGFGFSGQVRDLLTKVDGLLVASRTATDSLTGKPPADWSDLLGVRYLLEGTIETRENESFALDLNLVDTDSGLRIWSQRYQGTLDNLLKLAYDVTRVVIEVLELDLSQANASRIGQPATDSVGALEQYLLGARLLSEPPDPTVIDRAEAAFSNAVAEDPGFIQALAGLCQVNLLKYRTDRGPEDFERARARCEEALRVDQQQREAISALGELYLVSGEPESAVRYFEAALALSPLDPVPVIGLARAYRDLNEDSMAEQWYRNAVRDFPTYADAHAMLASFLFGRGRVSESIPSFEAVVDLYPESATALADLGGAYFMAGDYQAALDNWEASLRIDPSSSAYANTGTAYYFLGRLEDAKHMYELALEGSEEDYRLWMNLGDACTVLDDRACADGAFTTAVDLLQRVLAVNGNFMSLHSAMAACLAYFGRRDEALGYLTTALEAAQDDFYIYYDAALAFGRLGELGQAGKMIMRAVELGYPKLLVEGDPQFEEVRVHALELAESG